MEGDTETHKFQEHLSQYRNVVYSGLQCDSIMFDGQVNASTRINLLYDDVNRHYHVLTNLTGTMAQRYVCNGCNKGCKQGVTHKCDVSCIDCMSVPPCVPVGDQRIPCHECNRYFRSKVCFNNHKIIKRGGSKKTLCESKRCCALCGANTSDSKHECNKVYCKNCASIREVGHLCVMAPLQNQPRSIHNVLFVFYEFETTQDTR
jgi:hypothetical protein